MALTVTLGVAFLVIYVLYGFIVNPTVWFIGSWAIWFTCSSGFIGKYTDGGDVAPGLVFGLLCLGFVGFLVLTYVAHKNLDNDFLPTIFFIFSIYCLFFI